MDSLHLETQASSVQETLEEGRQVQEDLGGMQRQEDDVRMDQGQAPAWVSGLEDWDCLQIEYHVLNICL